MANAKTGNRAFLLRLSQKVASEELRVTICVSIFLKEIDLFNR
jgi:hypothetical protein